MVVSNGKITVKETRPFTHTFRERIKNVIHYKLAFKKAKLLFFATLLAGVGKISENVEEMKD